MRIVLLGSVGAHLLGGLSSLLRTPLTRSDTAFETSSRTWVWSTAIADGEVHALLIEPVGVANTGDVGGSLTATYNDSLA
jgi:hypothetical protein